ncbi:MAG: protein-L-isoaspartate(D-aspartate) O-methyltransferase [Acidobacteria bacterium]|nr:protein-L-isoaspartate(D-aspartate) O-methyltransferase [Acidobacteriota bacterium]
MTPEDRYALARHRMVERQIRARGVRDERVLEAMESVPRECFVPPGTEGEAYADHPLPIGLGQTISQPYIVAYMTEEARIRPADRVLEIGTGSGYQAAVLSRVAAEVFTVECLPDHARAAASLLARLGCANVSCREGDGRQGWPERAPFDAILVTAAAEGPPPALVEQLAPGGRMIIPLGGCYGAQYLCRLRRTDAGAVIREPLIGVRFVPLVTPGERL